MNLTDKRLRELDSPELTADERAALRCRLTADFIHIGQYERARESLGELWRGIGQRPHVEGLEDRTAAEVLLQCGALSGWLGTSKRVEGAQDAAKDLISEALRMFSAHGRQTKVSEAEYELGMCYWRAGAFDEARLILHEAVSRLGATDVEQRAKILIRSTLVEISAGRYHDALNILDEAAPIFQGASDALKGKWHAQMGLVMRRFGFAEGRTDYIDRAIIEITAAIYHFEEAHHERYCANNLNNIAPLFAKLERYEEAHQHLDRAQRIFTRLNDAGNLAQVRETRARVFLAEKKYKRAADAIGGAVVVLEKAGESALLADALTVQAIVEARLGHYYLSLPTFRRAIKIAEQAGAQESAGLAALSLIEELGASHLSDEVIYKTYCHADDLLRQTQDAETIARLRACARTVILLIADVGMGARFSLSEALRSYEARFIRRALIEAEGIVTTAAKRLGISYQKLQYLLETRHEDLAPVRKPVKKRLRSIIKKSKK
jgi:tetratricopeptide (TPR) repeat protein